MMKSITLNGKKIDYTLNLSARARKVSLSIFSGGRFVVTCPVRVNERVIERFIHEKSAWVLDKIEHFKKKGPMTFAKVTQPNAEEYKRHAQQLAEKRVAHFNQVYGFQYKSIHIRNQKSRWGSCSSKGNLNFNFKIALLPSRLSDYIIVHELCHLGQMNHSKKFWDLVAKTMPDHRSLRNELKRIH